MWSKGWLATTENSSKSINFKKNSLLISFKMIATIDDSVLSKLLIFCNNIKRKLVSLSLSSERLWRELKVLWEKNTFSCFWAVDKHRVVYWKIKFWEMDSKI